MPLFVPSMPDPDEAWNSREDHDWGYEQYPPSTISPQYLGYDAPEYSHASKRLPRSILQPWHRTIHMVQQESLSVSSNRCLSVPSMHPQWRIDLPNPIDFPQIESRPYDHMVTMRIAEQDSSKSDETVGGVVAHLDYNLDTMVNFVSNMAQGMHSIFKTRICLADIDISRSVVHSRTASTALRKFVLQVLSSTRLPSSTVLLGLLYLSKRLAILSRKGDYTAGEVDVNSILVVALILSSKFMDDNTFQNKSWSEVSGLRLERLNRTEFLWLSDIKWDLHVDLDDPDGFNLWWQHWTGFSNPGSSILRSRPHGQTQLADRYAGIQSSSQIGAESHLPGLVHHSISPLACHQCAAYEIPCASVISSSTIPQGAILEWTPPSEPETGPATPNAWSLVDVGGFAKAATPTDASIWVAPPVLRSAVSLA